MQYTILKIVEEDYGCEGVPDGQEPMCSVLLRDEKKNEHWVKLSDAYLTAHQLREGDLLPTSSLPKQ
ncbi:hypothetical protein [uncultured Ruminococcus sp.]|uniref:hypothetical protein n=1 Tax=uncultured Ruminococcus sp. TaxID=165186 RepID=UPI00261EFCFB|nr:hypothetical protein [uncultured Ruminococcus sp.]